MPNKLTADPAPRGDLFRPHRYCVSRRYYVNVWRMIQRQHSQIGYLLFSFMSQQPQSYTSIHIFS